MAPKIFILIAAFILFAYPQGTDANIGLFHAGLSTASFTVTTFTASFYFGIAITAMVWFISLAFVHRNDSQLETFYTHTLHPASIMLGALLAKIVQWLFSLPMLIKTHDTTIVQKDCCESTQSQWAYIAIFTSPLFGLAAYFSIRGFADSVWAPAQSLPVGITFAVVCALLFIIGLVFLYMGGKGGTAKYTFAMIAYLWPPYLFDQVPDNVIPVLARGFIMLGIYLVMGVIFYFYMRAWQDPFFSDTQRSRYMDRVWFIVFLSGFQGIIYVGQSIGNHIDIHDVPLAFYAQAITISVLAIFAVIVYISGLYSGYSCGTVHKCKTTHKC